MQNKQKTTTCSSELNVSSETNCLLPISLKHNENNNNNLLMNNTSVTCNCIRHKFLSGRMDNGVQCEIPNSECTSAPVNRIDSSLSKTPITNIITNPNEKRIKDATLSPLTAHCYRPHPAIAGPPLHENCGITWCHSPFKLPAADTLSSSTPTSSSSSSSSTSTISSSTLPKCDYTDTFNESGPPNAGCHLNNRKSSKQPKFGNRPSDCTNNKMSDVTSCTKENAEQWQASPLPKTQNDSNRRVAAPKTSAKILKRNPSYAFSAMAMSCSPMLLLFCITFVAFGFRNSAVNANITPIRDYANVTERGSKYTNHFPFLPTHIPLHIQYNDMPSMSSYL